MDRYGHLDMTVVGTESQLNMFMQMCAWMEACGNIGHTTSFKVDYAGEENAHMKFFFNEVGQYERYRRMELNSVKQYSIGGEVLGFNFK